MSRATPPRGEGTPTAPRSASNPHRFEAWLAVALCTVVLLASSAILERSRSFSRALLELERERKRGTDRTQATAPTEREVAPVRLVILLALDGLRADRMAGPGRPDGAPRLAALGSEGIAFQTVLAPASHALIAHKSILTGRYPGTLMQEETGADLVELAALREPARYLAQTFTRVRGLVAESFRAGGFRTAGFTDGAWLDAPAGFGEGFELFVDSGGGLAADLERALDWLALGRGQPAFLFLQTSELAGCVRGESAGEHDEPETRAGYDARLRRVDAALGEFLDGLRQRGLYEEALIALTAGHGLSLGEGGRVGHGGLHLEELRVPLLLKFPQEFELVPGVRHQAAELVDLAPTLLEAAGLAVPAGLDGRSLLAIVRRGARGRDCLLAESVFRGQGRGQASPAARTFLRPGRWQVIHDPARGEASVFDLREDPCGLVAHAIASHAVPALLDALLARAQPAARRRLRREPEPGPELVRALAELGYAGEASAGPGPAGPDAAGALR